MSIPKTFTIHTNSHDASGEPCVKRIDYGFLGDVSMFIALSETVSSLGMLMIGDGVTFKEHEYRDVYLSLEKRLKASMQVMFDKNIMTDKWSLRTSWYFGPDSELEY